MIKQSKVGRFLIPLFAAGLMAVGANSWALYEDDEYWETDDLLEDDYGYYDGDFEWGVDDEGAFDSWYGDADQDWGAYDDAGDDGWFDW